MIAGSVTKQKAIIPYFGYGAFRSSKMIAALLHRVPEHEEGIIRNHRVYIQKWEDISPQVKTILIESWTLQDKFKRYVLRRKKGMAVEGTIWYVTSEELELIGEFEIDKDFLWMERSKLVFENRKGLQIVGYAHTLPGWYDALLPSPQKYKLFLNSFKKMLTAGKNSNKLSGE